MKRIYVFLAVPSLQALICASVAVAGSKMVVPEKDTSGIQNRWRSFKKR